MTAQSAEVLRLDGRELPLWSTPLDDYYELAGIERPFAMVSSALWRGYVGTWELTAKHLYIVAIDATWPDGRDASLQDIFPGFGHRAFAHWYTGTLIIPEGDLLEYFHGGFGGTYERERVISVDRGVEVRRRVITNAGPHARGRA